MSRNLKGKIGAETSYQRWGVTFSGQLKDGKLTYIIRGKKCVAQGSLQNAFAEMIEKIITLDSKEL